MVTPRHQLYQVMFTVGAEDSHYCNTVWVHQLRAWEAQAFVAIINMLDDLGNIVFDKATMMGDSRDSTRPDHGWGQHTNEEGVEFRYQGREVHVYPDRDTDLIDPPKN